MDRFISATYVKYVSTHSLLLNIFLQYPIHSFLSYSTYQYMQSLFCVCYIVHNLKLIHSHDILQILHGLLICLSLKSWQFVHIAKIIEYGTFCSNELQWTYLKDFKQQSLYNGYRNCKQFPKEMYEYLIMWGAIWLTQK